MSFLSSVTSGKQIGAQIHVIAGVNGVGKTSFAASFPSPIILDLEDGSRHLNVTRIESAKIPTLAAVREALKELADTSHSYQTVVIDSVESLESLIFDFVCHEGEVDSIEEYEGGYGKGYMRSREIMRDVMVDLKRLQAKGITSILVAHTQVKSHTDPATNQTYDRIIMRANDKLAAVIKDLADNVLFANFKVFTTEVKGKTRAHGDGQRVILTQPRPGFDAKNRLELPLELPLSYDAFIEACASSNEDSSVLVLEIEEMASGVDDKLRVTVAEQVKKYRQDLSKLKEIKNRLMKYVA